MSLCLPSNFVEGRCQIHGEALLACSVQLTEMTAEIVRFRVEVERLTRENLEQVKAFALVQKKLSNAEFVVRAVETWESYALHGGMDSLVWEERNLLHALAAFRERAILT